MLAQFEEGRSVYSGSHAEVYDAMQRARGRGRVSEADQLAQVIRRHNPGARSVLDVACGTGTHIVGLHETFDDVEGLDLSESMLERARAKVPDTILHRGDMRDFRLDRTYDALISLCFTLGYTRSFEELDAVLASMSAHLCPGGVVVAEPWWFLENTIDVPVAGDLSKEPDRVISRLSVTRRQGRDVRIHLRYTIAEPDGIREFDETEVLRLYSREEYLDAFARAGLEAHHLEGPPNGRGLLIGVRTP